MRKIQIRAIPSTIGKVEAVDSIEWRDEAVLPKVLILARFDPATGQGLSGVTLSAREMVETLARACPDAVVVAMPLGVSLEVYELDADEAPSVG